MIVSILLNEGVLRWLAGSSPERLSAQTGGIVAGLLVLLLVGRELVRAGQPRDTERLLAFGVAIVPLCLAFALVVLERFQLLA